LLEKQGTPTENNKYVFNGDFVDRGAHGVEVLMIIMSLKIVYPDYVHINRGNHEDIDINRVYGFYDEVINKYRKRHKDQQKQRHKAEDLFLHITALYKYMPLCTLIEETAFVVHGGLMRNEKWTLEDIDDCPRSTFYATLSKMYQDKHLQQMNFAASPSPKTSPSPKLSSSPPGRKRRRSTISSLQAMKLDLRSYSHIVEDLVWSDPDMLMEGRRENTNRQAGIFYGKSATLRFLEHCRVPNLVRSHECCERGHELHSLGAGKQIHTIFSASNYNDADNYGAILTFSGGSKTPRTYKYKTNKSAKLSIAQQNRQTLAELICRHKHALIAEFKAADSKGSGKITASQWIKCVNKEMEGCVEWAEIQPNLAPTAKDGKIDYNSWISKYKMVVKTTRGDTCEDDLVHALYGNHQRLLQIFRLFDKDGNGVVDREEFLEKCDWVNTHLSEEQHFDGGHLFNLIDVDHGGSIDINELFEAFRVYDEGHANGHWRPIKQKLKLTMISGAQSGEQVTLSAAVAEEKKATKVA